MNNNNNINNKKKRTKSSHLMDQVAILFIKCILQGGAIARA